jgi:hypothetical protein
MELREAIERWRDFYAAVANASAALVGLVFVGVSIQLGRRPLGGGTRLLATESVVNLLHPLWASLIMLTPVAPAAKGAGLGLLALGSLLATAGIWYPEARRVRREPRLTFAYRYLVPLVAAAILAGGAIGMAAGRRVAVYAPAAFVFLMFLAGTQNVWALLLSPDGPSGPDGDR